jgi:hypothetical protein
MRSTICHRSTGRTIIAYLSLYDCAVRSARIVAYMELMHFASGECVRTMLKYYADRGTITRVRRGWYQGHLEIAS